MASILSHPIRHGLWQMFSVTNCACRSMAARTVLPCCIWSMSNCAGAFPHFFFSLFSFSWFLAFFVVSFLLIRTFKKNARYTRFRTYVFTNYAGFRSALGCFPCDRKSMLGVLVEFFCQCLGAIRANRASWKPSTFHMQRCFHQSINLSMNRLRGKSDNACFFLISHLFNSSCLCMKCSV